MDTDQPDVPLHPPSIFGAAYLLGFTLRVFVGEWTPLPRIVMEGVGGALMIMSVIIGVSAIATFAEGGERLRVASPSQILFTRGVFRFSRNPIYLAMSLFGVGFSIATQNIWLFLTTLAASAIIHFFVIPEEEDYLLRRFGADYRSYRERVRRWV